jgi:hypothetical protein
VVRRLARVPRLVAVVATLSLAQALLWVGEAIGGDLRGAQLFPQPPGIPSWHLGALVITRADTALLVFAPLAAVGVALGFRYSPSRSEAP